MVDSKALIDTIKQSQRCQRNWDLSKKVKPEDVDILKLAVTQCPSKQNRVFYRAVFVQNRNIIKQLHESSDCFAWQFNPRKVVTNSQLLANMLVIFFRDRDQNIGPRTESEYSYGIIAGKSQQEEDRALGIAGGYLNLTAHMLGYKTGFYNSQHNQEKLHSIFGELPLLTLGIGYSDNNRNSNVHHTEPTFIFPSFDKEIKVEEIN
tara:strand:- start:215 stop:832 length:618 start_codon:yes stop_codon:yes gene_type:complete